jgi:Mycothiol maleylpyruvate isomerase N-terminal domain
VLDVRPLLVEERARLVDRLRSLEPSQWATATALPRWTVRDIALHLLDDDLGRLSRDRDGETAGLIVVDSYTTLVDALNAKNQRWVDAAAGLSRGLVAELLAWSGHEIDVWLRDVDLHADSKVAWASSASVRCGLISPATSPNGGCTTSNCWTPSMSVTSASTPPPTSCWTHSYGPSRTSTAHRHQRGPQSRCKSRRADGR